ncbi:MBL fold metallo-hydrolase [Puia dinghuensis]|uniref:MBL fold metallo-hydrolase n=1 Tax=Puia dinghuensis TaxID=1792502 RepID=A0A8J2XTH5_9BACT|nr:MBL fold metallo-hydrolase [Puia dinghuensis]
MYAQRSIAYEVYAIRFAKSGFIKASEIAIGGSDKDSVADCYMFWLLKGGGRNILVDAGFTLNENSTRNNSWNSSNYIRPDSALLRLKLQPGEITDIIITHPHWDHIGGITLFPTAQVWMQQDDYTYFVGTAWQKNGDHGGFYKEDVKAIVATNLDGRLHLVKGDSIELFPGIRAFIGSKHTWESQYVAVNTSAERVIIASDNSWYYYNLQHLTSIPPKFTFDPKAYVHQLKRMRRMQPNISLIIPGHDAAVFSQFPTVAEDVVRIR